MPEHRQCEFYLVRYVPDPVKNEFVNIGVLLREAPGPGNTSSGNPGNLGSVGTDPAVRFTRDWSRVRCLDAEADLALLEALESEIRLRLHQTGETRQPVLDELLDELLDSFSNSVQLSGPKACLAESLPAGMEQLMKIYVEPRRRPAAERRIGGRQAVLNQMRAQFERAGVWDLMSKRISMAQYTRPGDPLRIDCGYRPNGVIRMFQAVSLDGDLDDAKVLAFSAAAIREGVLRREGAGLELTAIVEPLMEVRGDQEAGDRTEQYRFAVETMEERSIRVLTTADLPRAAEAARLDLRV